MSSEPARPSRRAALAILGGVALVGGASLTLYLASRPGKPPAPIPAGRTPGSRTTLPGPGGLALDFAWVPPGSFRMGSPTDEAERRDDEKQHPVTLSTGFWMGVHPVTQAQWRAVMGGGKRPVEGIADADLERLPVENVSWVAAQEFCTKLAGLVGKPIALPTEAQWEYACRAGTTTPFHFGASCNGTQANCDGTAPYGTAEKGPYLGRPSVVGSYPPNAWGLHDMHGNVWEWCADAYRADYDRLPATDPVYAPEGAPDRVLRGGAWNRAAAWCRAAYRNSVAPSSASAGYGLRVCWQE